MFSEILAESNLLTDLDQKWWICLGLTLGYWHCSIVTRIIKNVSVWCIISQKCLCTLKSEYEYEYLLQACPCSLVSWSKLQNSCEPTHKSKCPQVTSSLCSVTGLKLPRVKTAPSLRWMGSTVSVVWPMSMMFWWCLNEYVTLARKRSNFNRITGVHFVCRFPFT